MRRARLQRALFVGALLSGLFWGLSHMGTLVATTGDHLWAFQIGEGALRLWSPMPGDTPLPIVADEWFPYPERPLRRRPIWPYWWPGYPGERMGLGPYRRVYIELPLWLPTALLGSTWLSMFLIRRWRASHGPGGPVCPTCGYNLTGLQSGRCPECGCILTRADLASKPQGSPPRSRRARAALPL